ncbi:MAG TPA: zinc-dependent alcohol dehydrogenase family protein [Planctomycetaceae bacterium]|jgi:propanol-preferring alcohol dehydrogenase|nr:zinc-dependent alcohol dehydrogenase family protein [Planctomycetaceae bacterium]
MKAMVLDEIAPVSEAPLRLRELPELEPQAGEVRIKVRCCGVCRTDLHVIEGDLPRRKMPVICGHQVVGIVDEVGPRCRLLSVGQRVGIPWLRNACGQCAYCRAGQENLCEFSVYTGYDADGGYAESAIVPEAFAYVIPDAFDDVHAAPLLCAGIIGYRSLKRADLPPGGRLAMYGFGSSAHIILQIALHRGSEVYVVTRGESHRQLAREMGATWVGESAAQMPAKVNSAIMFAPAGNLVPEAMAQLDKGGTLALAGIYMSEIPPLDYTRTLFYEKNIRSVTANTREDGRELLAEAAAISLRPHVTTYPLSEANRALLDLKQDRVNGTAVLVP